MTAELVRSRFVLGCEAKGERKGKEEGVTAGPVAKELSEAVLSVNRGPREVLEAVRG